MPFLSRQRSLNKPSNPQNMTKPLPPLPPIGPIENVPRKLKRKPPPVETARNDAGNIIRRMSHMFRPKRKSPPENPTMDGKHQNDSPQPVCIPESTWEGSAESGESDVSVDDIRRPSGLGSAVSLEMLPPSPGGNRLENINLSDGIYTRTRAVSSPNLLRSFSLKAKNKLLRATSRRGSSAQLKKPSRPPVQFPVEVLDVILSHLPRRTIASISHLSRTLCSAARINLYRKLDLDSLSLLQLQKLLGLLASRRDLTDLVEECVCYAWPTFFEEKAENEEQQLQNRFLAATFTLALQRMTNLVKLTLPNFDQSLLAYHTAFGLRSLTFMSPKLTAEETSALFQWLDGQINVVELKFPNLEDNEGPAQDAQQPEPIHRHQPRHSVHLKPPGPAGGGSRGTSPISPSFSPDSRSPSPNSAIIRQSLLGSPTLLPLLTTLHATPAILALLQPHNIGSSNSELASSACSATSSASGQTRPLQKVYLNISTTLYTGLRPNTVMASLRGSVAQLGVRFCDNVDKRTVEKVLGSIGAILGSAAEEGGQEGDEAGGQWKGLQSLEVSFRTTSALMPGMEETLYKTLQTTLPRYTQLQKLHLGFLSSKRFARPLPRSPLEVSKGDKVFKFPTPPSSRSNSIRMRKGSYPLQAIASAAASAIYPSVSTIRGLPRRASSSLASEEERNEEKQLGAQDQAKVELWTKQCPSLRSVYLSGVTWKCHPDSEPVAAPAPASPSRSYRNALSSPSTASSTSSSPISSPNKIRSKLNSATSPSPSASPVSSHSPLFPLGKRPPSITTSIAPASVSQPLPSPPPPVPPLPPVGALTKGRSRSNPALSMLALYGPSSSNTSLQSATSLITSSFARHGSSASPSPSVESRP